MHAHTQVGIRQNTANRTSTHQYLQNEGHTIEGVQAGWSNPSDPESKCLYNLYTSDYESHKNRNPPRVSGTLEWFLNHEKYRHWRQEKESSLLWVSADPGCGKSVLASFLVDELKSPVSQSELPGTVCFFFFKDDDEQQKNSTFALSALLHQLFTAKSSLIKHAMEEFKGKGEKFTKELGVLWRIFTAAATDPGCGNVICIIDGLDECEESTRNELIKFLVSIYLPANCTARNTDETFLKFVLTSRPYGFIEEQFARLPTIRLKAEEQIPAINVDIELVINAEVKALGKHKLVKGADRTFLWVSLILKILKDPQPTSESELHEILNNIPSDLDAIYEKVLRGSREPQKAKIILQIVVAATRPLTLNEMDIALAIRPGHKSIEDLKPNRLFIQNIVKDICGLFVKIIDSKIYLIHQTAKEFLIKHLSTTIPTTEMWKHSLCPIESSLTLAKSCIYYLLFTVFETHPLVLSSTIPTLESQQQIYRYTEEHVFLDYAAKHWATHVLEAKIWEEQEISSSALEVLDSGSRRLLTWFLVYQTAINHNFCYPKNVTSLTIASYIGHDAAVQQLIGKGADVNGRDDLYGSALNAAAISEHHNIVKMLLNRGAIIYLFGSEYKDLIVYCSL
ncbi:hypothetical protein BDD12DRAFT_918318 [Trichophaea hybrida]|nr:hypothetical protein BDD12DRAFT_918318 [Trichophaea hybrida]